MKTLQRAAVTLALALAAAALHAEEAAPPAMPEMPKPQKEHEWLQQLVGEWTTESTMDMGDGSEPFKWKGTETVRGIGGFWVVAEGTGNVMDTPMTSILTLGYDAAKGKYVGTFLSDGMDYLWVYTGTVEGDKIILETEGPCPMQGGKMTKFQEVIEFKGKNNRTFTSSFYKEDGSQQQIMAAEYKRKK